VGGEVGGLGSGHFFFKGENFHLIFLLLSLKVIFLIVSPFPVWLQVLQQNLFFKKAGADYEKGCQTCFDAGFLAKPNRKLLAVG
jgi:hypothetical protein